MLATRPPKPHRRSLPQGTWLALWAGLLLAACSSISAERLERIHKTHWRLIAMEKEMRSPDEYILLRIEDRRQLFGQMNSSSYFGSYEADKQGNFRVLNLAPIQRGSSTSTAPEVLRYLSLILLVDSMRLDASGQLVLYSEGKELLRYADSLRLRTKAAAVSPY